MRIEPPADPIAFWEGLVEKTKLRLARKAQGILNHPQIGNKPTPTRIISCANSFGEQQQNRGLVRTTGVKEVQTDESRIRDHVPLEIERSFLSDNPVVTPLIFVLTGCDPTEKVAATSVIEEFGGLVSTTEYHDHSADAVITFKIIRSEKILGAITSGRPLLHPNYFHACQDASRLVEFEDYMWKEEDASSESDKRVAKITKVWYELFKEDPTKRPYTKLCVYLADQEDPKKDAYRRLIQTGGGEVAETMEGSNIVITNSQSIIDQAVKAKKSVKPPQFLCDLIIK